MSIPESCQPRKVLSVFEAITQIPHGSFHEEKIAAFFCDYAKKHGAEAVLMPDNNVLIRKGATPGYENHPPVILQGHMDMVCESDGTRPHDFLHDPLEISERDGWIVANGTTLGADDGIAGAMMLALLTDENAQHPPLEYMLTVQEEVGLTGAQSYDYSLLRGRRLINLDSEDEGRACVGCAGGARCDFSRDCLRDLNAGGSMTVELCVLGLSGGHSGMDIGLGRQNAYALLLKMLREVYAKFPFAVAALDGGGKDNAIARNARAVLSCSAFCYVYLQLTAKKYAETLIGDDRDGTITVERLGQTETPFSVQDTEELLRLSESLPNGVLSMNADFPTLVDTSANLGVCQSAQHALILTVSIRSLSEKTMTELKEQMAEIAAESGFRLTLRGEYPGWEYQPKSELTELYRRTYFDLYGKEPVIETIHAGLECGIIKNHIPELDAISFGPDMQNVHTPSERLNVASVGRVYEHLLYMLREL